MKLTSLLNTTLLVTGGVRALSQTASFKICRKNLNKFRTRLYSKIKS